VIFQPWPLRAQRSFCRTSPRRCTRGLSITYAFRNDVTAPVPSGVSSMRTGPVRMSSTRASANTLRFSARTVFLGVFRHV